MSNYDPTHPGAEITVEWLFSELQRIGVCIDQTTSQLYEETFAAPDKPKEGLTMFADGTLWNPGAGRGLYLYSGAAWTKL